MKKNNFKNNIPTVEKASSLLQEMDKYHYMRLDKLRQDCQYYLTYGQRNAKHLEGMNLDTHIENMWAEWRACRIEPEWCTAIDIELFRRAMSSETNGVTFIMQDFKAEIWDWMTNEGIIGKDEGTDINKYLSSCWFVEKILFEVADGEAYYVLWIGGKLVDVFGLEFIDEILNKQKAMINYITKGGN